MKILLAVDGSACSEAAIDALINQHKAEGTDVRVLSVLEWPKNVPDSMMFAEGPAAAGQVVSAHDEERRRTEAVADAAVHRLARAGFSAAAEVREGDARHEIVGAATEWGADAVVVGSHGRRRLERLLVGSVSEGVVRHAPCSVEVIRPRHVC